MALIKYYRPEFSFDTFDKVWEQFFDGKNALKHEKKYFDPQMDISETKENYTVTLAVPGIKKEDIKIEVNEDKLEVSGERKTLDTDVSVTYHKLQTAYGKFSQSFCLPKDVDKENIQAKQEDGILTLVVPKREKKENKSVIEVK